MGRLIQEAREERDRLSEIRYRNIKIKQIAIVTIEFLLLLVVSYFLFKII